MEESPLADRKGLAIAIAALLGVLVALAALLGIWPFGGELSEEEFIAQGDEICREAHDEFRSLQDEPVRTPSDAEELVSALIEVAEEERDAISDLDGPDDLEDPVERYLAARDRGIGVLRDGLAAAEDADAGAYEEFQAELASTQIDPRFRIAGEIGFEVCSKPLVDREELERQAAAPAGGDLSSPPTVNNPPTGTP